MTKDDAIQYFKGVTAMARKLRCSRTAIYIWEEIPELRQYQIQVLSDGALRVDPKFTGTTTD